MVIPGIILVLLLIIVYQVHYCCGLKCCTHLVASKLLGILFGTMFPVMKGRIANSTRLRLSYEISVYSSSVL